MIHTVYVVVDPKGDRPYVSSTPPSPHLDRRGGEVKVYAYDLYIPDHVEHPMGEALLPKKVAKKRPITEGGDTLKELVREIERGR